MRLFLFLVFIFSGYARAQSLVQPNLVSRKEVSTVGYWSIGEKKKYRFTQIRSDFKKDRSKPFNEEQTDFDLTVTVLDSTDSSYLMRLSYANLKVTPEKKLTERRVEPLKSFHIDYTTDEFGVFDSIVNLVELMDQVKRNFLNSLPEEDKSNDSIRSIVSELSNKLFDNEELLKLYFQRDILLIHSFYGVQLSLDEPVDLELEYPTIGDVQMTGKGTVRLRMIDSERDFCRILMTQRPYKEEVDKFLVELMSQFSGVDFQRFDLNEFSFSSISKLNGTMELSSGWMKKISSKTTVQTTVKSKKMKTVFQVLLEEN